MHQCNSIQHIWEKQGKLSINQRQTDTKTNSPNI